jgi:SWIM zinc finger
MTAPPSEASPPEPLASGQWPAARIHALAPDAASQKAGVKLAAAAPWSGYGVRAQERLLWGDCKGSGAKPYQVTVEFPADSAQPPAYACTCPSRKFPCKHAVGLMLLWSAGHVADAEVPGRVREWLSGRQERAERKAAQEAKAAEQSADPKAAARSAQAATRRSAQRLERIGAGLDDLDLWLRDQLRAGLTGLKAAGYRPLDDLARRLVDAQAPGVATRVRRLAGLLSADDWPEQVLAELAQLHLLIEGWRNRDALPAPLAATVRRRVGLSSTAAEITATGERIADRWLVLGARDVGGDKLVERRVWLQGEESSRTALLLAFAPSGQSPGLAFPVGATVEAELAFAPEALPQRAVIADAEDLRMRPDGGLAPHTATLDEAASAFAAAVAADPWTTAVPVVIGAAVPVVDPKNWTWQIVDAKSQTCVPLVTEGSGDELSRADEMHYVLLAAGGGRPCPLFGLYHPGGFAAVTVFTESGAVSLT